MINAVEEDDCVFVINAVEEDDCVFVIDVVIPDVLVFVVEVGWKIVAFSVLDEPELSSVMGSVGPSVVTVEIG